jgi:hypothetical protein
VSAAPSRNKLQGLRLSWIALGLAVAAAIALGYAGHWFLGKARGDEASSRAQLAEATARLEAARRERDDFRASSEVFRDLVKRGILEDENRLELVERLDRLKVGHRLHALEYEIAPQRPLAIAGVSSFTAVDVRGSRVKVTARALHEGDALAFLEELSRPPRGFTPATRCHLMRLDAGAGESLAPRIEAQCTLEWITLKDKRGPRAR